MEGAAVLMTPDEIVERLQAESKIASIEISLMRVDRSYQRDPSGKLVDKIADDWDSVSSELILVADRGDGEYWIVNGQHRSLAARKVGVEFLDARVIDTSWLEDPASIEAMFRLRTNVRMSDKPLERFKAQLRAGNEESLKIVEILERFGTEVNDTANPSKDYGINAISAVEKLYRYDDQGALLAETFQLIKDVYGQVGGRQSSSAVMTAFAWFILKHAEDRNTDRDRLVEKLQLVGLGALDRKARTIASEMNGSLWMNYYRAMVGVYNERLGAGTRLEWRMQGAGSWKGNTSGFSGFSSVASHH